jgi:2-furoate---CoA ligase
MLDLGRTFLQSVERSPNALAIIDGDKRMTYAQWHELIQRTAAGLQEIGIVRGDHLLVVLQNRFEMATLHWACQFLGVIVTPLNWRAKPEEVEYCAVDAQAKAVVCTKRSVRIPSPPVQQRNRCRASPSAARRAACCNLRSCNCTLRRRRSWQPAATIIR